MPAVVAPAPPDQVAETDVMVVLVAVDVVEGRRLITRLLDGGRRWG